MQLAPWGAAEGAQTLSLATALALGESALLQSNGEAILSAWNAASVEDASQAEPDEGEQTVDAQSETHEGTLLDPEDSATIPPTEGEADNGVEAKTIQPAGDKGYLVWQDVYITNTSTHTPDLGALMASLPAARFTDELPQILILHTHGTESYTMPPGEEYNDDGATRTTDTNYNVVRVGDEMAEVFEEAGISVLHDRTLYDADGYNDAYTRADAAIAAYLEKYPSIHFVLDVHRDAIEDSDGKAYKVVSQVEGQTAAQVSIVVGSDGSGKPHETWQENLKLALLLQQHITESYPTLMRPMYLRASRYNQHESTGALLVEIGAAGNSLDEALYAARLFAGKMVETLETLKVDS
jgi:stage II sporulation protein P